MIYIETVAMHEQLTSASFISEKAIS
jgi:hypothetical protein